MEGPAGCSSPATQRARAEGCSASGIVPRFASTRSSSSGEIWRDPIRRTRPSHTSTVSLSAFARSMTEGSAGSRSRTSIQRARAGRPNHGFPKCGITSTTSTSRRAEMTTSAVPSGCTGETGTGVTDSSSIDTPWLCGRSPCRPSTTIGELALPDWSSSTSSGGAVMMSFCPGTILSRTTSRQEEMPRFTSAMRRCSRLKSMPGSVMNATYRGRAVSATRVAKRKLASISRPIREGRFVISNPQQPL